MRRKVSKLVALIAATSLLFSMNVAAADLGETTIDVDGKAYNGIVSISLPTTSDVFAVDALGITGGDAGQKGIVNNQIFCPNLTILNKSSIALKCAVSVKVLPGATATKVKVVDTAEDVDIITDDEAATIDKKATLKLVVPTEATAATGIAISANKIQVNVDPATDYTAAKVVNLTAVDGGKVELLLDAAPYKADGANTVINNRVDGILDDTVGIATKNAAIFKLAGHVTTNPAVKWVDSDLKATFVYDIKGMTDANYTAANTATSTYHAMAKTDYTEVVTVASPAGTATIAPVAGITGTVITSAFSTADGAAFDWLTMDATYMTNQNGTLTLTKLGTEAMGGVDFSVDLTYTLNGVTKTQTVNVVF